MSHIYLISSNLESFSPLCCLAHDSGGRKAPTAQPALAQSRSLSVFSSPLPEVIQLMASICFRGQLLAVPAICNNCALAGSQQWGEVSLRWVTAGTKDMGENNYSPLPYYCYRQGCHRRPAHTFCSPIALDKYLYWIDLILTHHS